MVKRIKKSKEEWKKDLGPERFHVLREKGTEAPFSGKLLYNKKKGIYVCGACGFPLFSSENKFWSGTGWPSFDRPISGDNVETGKDASHGMQRNEVVCPRCGSHLGHVFDDGPTETKKRYCINSLSLKFREEE